MRWRWVVGGTLATVCGTEVLWQVLRAAHRSVAHLV